MNARQRFRSMFDGKPVDRPFLAREGAWVQAFERWQTEGMTDESVLDFDGLTACNMHDLTPPFETRVVREEGDTVVMWSGSGQLIRTWNPKANTRHDPGYEVIESSVKDRDTWLKISKRLDPGHPDHLGDNWAQRVRNMRASGKPIRLGAGHSFSIFGYARELIGDDIYLFFYDQPELMQEIMDFLADRIVHLIERVTADLEVDCVHVWEDMAYKGAPLIGPDMFRRFMLEPTRRICQAAYEHNIPCVMVDSDGDITKLLPLWLEAGVNAVEPFEVAAGMDVNAVRREFGDELFIFGGFDKRALPQGRDAIDTEFQRLRPTIEAGRYMLCIDHSIPPDSPWDNVRYYLDRKREICGHSLDPAFPRYG